MKSEKLKFLRLLFVTFLLKGALSCEGEPSRLQTFDNAMMSATFKIQSGNNLGTAFVMFQLLPGQTNVGSYVLVTAAHVLQSMPSSNAVLVLRAKAGDTYQKVNWEIPIRQNGTNLWTQHPSADVAAMRIPLPQGIDLVGIPTTLLATDEMLTNMLIHPGDELRVLGYPYGLDSSDAGFPILRSGRIASYPLTPTRKTKTFLLDFRIFKGNSGGPVYILEQKQMQEGNIETVNFSAVMGLISEEAQMNEQITSLTETTIKTHDLGLGIVIQGELIKETIDLLPPLTPKQ
jgi:hypothetical protein